MMKKGENLVVFTLIAFVSFGLVLGYFFNTTSQDLTVKQVEDKPLENINFIERFFSFLFKNEEVMLSPQEPAVPTNRNVLCIYNINSVQSEEICKYYLEKRPGAESLGLNLLDSDFVDQYKEVMNSDIFYQKIIDPVLSYGEQHLEITHVAIAKDLPIVVIEGGQRYSAISYFFTPYRYIGTSPSYVGANATFNFNGDQIISYSNRGIHFNASNYLNSSGGYTTRFVASHLTALTLEDVKKMIDRSLGSPSPVSSWLIDKDPPVAGDPLQGGFSITDGNVLSLNQSLHERNISSNFITINSDLSILQTPNPVIGYVGPGTYHTGYSKYFATTPGHFALNVSSRAIYSTIESYAGFSTLSSVYDSPNFGQTLIVNSFSANAFGGTNYANSFSGAVGAVEEPGQAGIMTSTLYLFRNYAQGLTLAESVYLNQRSPITLFGDPLMKINDIETLKLPLGGECNDNNSCLSGVCEKDTFNVSRCQQLQISCMTPRNYDLLIESEQTSKCLNYTNTIICSNRQFIPLQTCSILQACSEKTVNGLKSASCLLINGELCSLDSECNSNKCGLDLEGQKRCVNAGSCAIGEKRGEVSTDKFACISDNQKRLCDNGIWTSSLSCSLSCSNGVCEEERNWSIAPNILKTKGGEYHSFYLNLNNNNRSVSNLFSNLSNGDSIFSYFNDSVRSGSFFLGGFGNDFVLKPYEGIIVRTSLDRNIILNGTAFNSAPPVDLSSGFNFVGIGYCSANYTAKTAIEEIYAVSPNCSLITQPNSFGGPIEYWSVNESYSQNGLKKDFKIYDYEPFYVKCISNTSFTWQPSCISQSSNITTLSKITSASNGQIFSIEGYRTLNDGGGGDFRYESSNADPPDGGTVFSSPILPGRFVRVFDSQGPIYPEWFGAYGDGIHGDQEAINSALSKFKRVTLQNKTYGLNTTPALYLSAGTHYPTYHSINLDSDYKIEGTDRNLSVLKLLDSTYTSEYYFSLLANRDYHIGAERVMIKNITIDGNFNRQTKQSTIHLVSIRGGSALVENVNFKGYGAGKHPLGSFAENFVLSQTLVYKDASSSRQAATFRNLDFTGVGNNGDVYTSSPPEVTHVLLGGANNFDDLSFLLPSGKDPAFNPADNGENSANWWPSFGGVVENVTIHDEDYTPLQKSPLNGITYADSIGLKIVNNTIKNFSGAGIFVMSWWNNNTYIGYNNFTDVLHGVTLHAKQSPTLGQGNVFQSPSHNNVLIENNSIILGYTSSNQYTPYGIQIYGQNIDLRKRFNNITLRNNKISETGEAPVGPFLPTALYIAVLRENLNRINFYNNTLETPRFYSHQGVTQSANSLAILYFPEARWNNDKSSCNVILKENKNINGDILPVSLINWDFDARIQSTQTSNEMCNSDSDLIAPVINAPANLVVNYLSDVSAVFSASDNKGSVSYSVNDSRFNISQSGLLTNKSSLGAGIYRINVSVNDSSNNFNSTIYQVDVNRISSSVYLTLNNIAGNLSIISGEGALISSSNVKGEGNISLLVDGIEVNNSLSILHKINITALGNHSVNASHSNTQNYTSNSTVFYIEVRELIDVISPIFTSIPSNLSIDYGQSVSAVFSASDNKGSVSYNVNDSRFNISQSGLLTNKTALGSGKYEIKITINDSSNNLNITNYRIDVLEEINPIALLANGLRQNATLTYGSPVNISVNVNGFILLRNGVDVTNDAGRNIILSFGVYNFTAVKNQFVSALTVTVNKASQTITFNSISDKKVGDEVVLSASSSSGLPVSFEVVSGENFVSPITGSFISGDNFEYNYFNVLLNIIKKFFVLQQEEVRLAPVALVGNKINLTGAGSVTVNASQSGNENYLPALSVSKTFNVGKGIAQIQFSNLNHVYDGSAKSVGVSTTPAGLTTTITYNGQTTAPINADSYNVVATINNVNYEGSSSAILIISKAEQTLTFNEISNKSVGEQFDLIASSTSGLSVVFEVVSGPASLSGNRLTVTGPGTIVVRAKQLGDVNYNPAQSIDRTINSDCGSGFIRVVDECNAICTDFTYTPFGVCSVTGEQTRSVVSSIPAGCVDGLPSLNRSCTRICEPNSLQVCDVIPNANVTGYKNKCDALGTNFTNENTCLISNCNSGFTLVGNECKAICTDFTYTPFGVCLANNTQVRAINSSIPNECVGGSPVLNQSCIYVPLFCEPNSIVACDAVSNAEVTGYKNKCNANGTEYLNESTCSSRKYVLNIDDFNVSIDSDKKFLRDSNNNIIIKIPSILDNSVLDDIDVRRSNGNESKEFVIVKNLDLLSGQTKSILLQRKNSNSNAVCIRDEPNLNNANDIKANCFKVRCPGNVGDYTCTLSGNTFEVSGLQNSGVIEDRLFCGDNLCSEGESCSSCATDCGLCSGANSGSNSNSGSGGSNSNSGSGSNQQIIIDDSSSRNNPSENISDLNQKIELNRKIRSNQDNSNIINYVIGFLIFLAIVIIIVLVSIFIRSPQRTYVPDANNSVFNRKEY